MADMTSTMMSGNYARSGSATLSNRYNDKTYALRGRNAAKVANARPDMQMLYATFGKEEDTGNESPTGRADWDLLISREGLYTPEGKRALPKGFRINPTVKKKKQAVETKKRLTTMDSITVEDLFGSDD